MNSWILNKDKLMNSWISNKYCGKRSFCGLNHIKIRVFTKLGLFSPNNTYFVP